MRVEIGVGGAFLEHHADHREIAIRGGVDEVDFKRKGLAVDRVFGRVVEVELLERVVLAVERDAAAVGDVDLEGVAIVDDHRRHAPESSAGCGACDAWRTARRRGRWAIAGGRRRRACCRARGRPSARGRPRRHRSSAPGVSGVASASSSASGGSTNAAVSAAMASALSSSEARIETVMNREFALLWPTKG